MGGHGGASADALNADDNAEDMLLIGRAQGIIMHERGLAPTAALIELCAQATRNELALADASRNIVAESSL